jgi:hypothetical protein
MLHTGLLWRPDRGVQVIGDSFGTSHLGYPGGAPLVKVTFEFPDGTRVQHASHHGHPFCADKRRDQAAHLIGTMTRPWDGPAVVGMDSNGTSAERNRDGSYYDPDPYAGQDWYPDLIFQTKSQYDASGLRVRWVADRDDGQMYLAGGLRDVAAVLGAPWAPTVGHWPTDPHPYRRIDLSLTTEHFRDALGFYAVASQLPGIDVQLLTKASDHFPAIGSYDTQAINHDYHRMPRR